MFNTPLRDSFWLKYFAIFALSLSMAIAYKLIAERTDMSGDLAQVADIKNSIRFWQMISTYGIALVIMGAVSLGVLSAHKDKKRNRVTLCATNAVLLATIAGLTFGTMALYLQDTSQPMGGLVFLGGVIPMTSAMALAAYGHAISLSPIKREGSAIVGGIVAVMHTVLVAVLGYITCSDIMI